MTTLEDAMPEKKELVTFRCPPDVHREAREWAKRHDRTMSWVIAKAVEVGWRRIKSQESKK